MAKKKVQRKKKKTTGLNGLLLGVIATVTAIVFMSSTVILIWGMLPTVIVAAFGAAKEKTRAITVGAINLAGCTPFLLHLWSVGRDIEDAVAIALDPRFIIVTWGSAGIGYVIDWALSGIVATVLLERAKGRVEDIREEQEELVKRWGREVKGDIPLDSFGFPIEKIHDKDSSKN